MNDGLGNSLALFLLLLVVTMPNEDCEEAKASVGEEEDRLVFSVLIKIIFPLLSGGLLGARLER